VSRCRKAGEGGLGARAAGGLGILLDKAAAAGISLDDALEATTADEFDAALKRISRSFEAVERSAAAAR
jgi:hypothetical protein